jgi:hypothetical protein
MRIILAVVGFIVGGLIGADTIALTTELAHGRTSEMWSGGRAFDCRS